MDTVAVRFLIIYQDLLPSCCVCVFQKELEMRTNRLSQLAVESQRLVSV